ncbi:glycosyltransferase [bacterium]|nr:glycosyltransferase [bacterium]
MNRRTGRSFAGLVSGRSEGTVVLPRARQETALWALPHVPRRPPVTPPAVASAARPSVCGKFLQLGNRRFWIKGVTYGAFRQNAAGESFPPFAQLCDDFEQMREAGINTLRLYSPPSDRIADAAAARGLLLVPDICWGPRRCELDDPQRVRFIFDWTREHSRRLAGHPAILMHSIGNEIPPLVVRWYGRERIERFLGDLWETVKEQDPRALVTYVNHPPTEYLNLPFLDVVAHNIYLERPAEFQAYLGRLQMLAGDRPVFLAEIGLDAHCHGEVAQAQFLDWQLRAVYETGLCGAIVYGWTDEWAIFDSDIDGWAFGLTKANREPKLALAAVSQIYNTGLYKLRRRPWPMVSVIVAVCNGARTINDCLASLSRLNYPRYEVVVVDDGSEDGTAALIGRHGMRCIRVPNGGLSRARNLGIAAARGDIVAFLDSDAYADADWLYFLVNTLEQQGAAAVGGPNLSPPEDGFLAQCVDHAPGNPTHVLTDNEHADHVPGCNMAFWKKDLEAIDFFDPSHRAAGDDVDVCWKLRARGRPIGFSPSGIVWHHRRGTWRGYLRQQAGYGFAEAHLYHRYPGHYNVFGYPVWRGGIYDGAHSSLRREGLPQLFRPRIYQGWFGGAQFQSLYQPFLTWWFQVFTTAEWQAATWCVGLTGLFAWLSGSAGAAGALGTAAAMILASLFVAGLAGVHAARAKQWRGGRRVLGTVTVAALHLVQPLARTGGRLRGWWTLRHTAPPVYPATHRLWGNLTQRDVWLHRVLEQLRANSWIARPGSEWAASDIDIEGPGPFRLQLVSVYEEHLEKARHYVRYRITARRKGYWLAVVASLMAFVPLVPLWPYLLPLMLPLLILLGCFLRARRLMVRGVSQIAVECGAPLGMTAVNEPVE